MRIAVIAVGKIKERGLREAIEDYIARIRHFARCEEIELRDGDEDEVVARFRKAIPPRATVVALDVQGKSYTSGAFAQLLERTASSGVPDLAFLIGGAFGLPRPAVQMATHRLSLSAMTLPHRLVRVVLLEQIYRGFTIWRNVPYAH